MNKQLEVRDLKKHFRVRSGNLHAVDGVTFSIEKGKTLGVVGESGCGKSTLGRTIIHLLEPTQGNILFRGEDITNPTKKRLKQLRQDMQIIFQDPFSSLNPRQTVGEIISAPMKIFNKFPRSQNLQEEVLRLMGLVGLSRRYINSYPHELDGGRRQRIGVARAISLNPEIIICDEPVSALDVSIQAQILNLMQDLQDEMGLTYVFISHNLAVVKHISTDILIMYLGKMVEMASSENIFRNRFHPYTKALFAAIPGQSGDQLIEGVKMLKGELSSPINPKNNCRFANRCIYSRDICFIEEPPLTEIENNHFVACHFVNTINRIEKA